VRERHVGHDGLRPYPWVCHLRNDHPASKVLRRGYARRVSSVMIDSKTFSGLEEDRGGRTGRVRVDSSDGVIGVSVSLRPVQGWILG
jgi:hypothetical protein